MENFWSPLQEIIYQNCLDYDKIWQVRKRVIDTHFLVLFIFKLVLSKNKQGYSSLLTELWESPELYTTNPNPVAASSLCEARQKLPEEIFLILNKSLLLAREKSQTLKSWNGHRVFAVDGSKINLPRELLLSGYRAPNRDQYYPQGIVSTIYHLESGLIYDSLLYAGKSERDYLLKQMKTLSIDDVLVLDRGYFSYLILNQAMEKGVHLICRLQLGSVNKRIQEFIDSDLDDTIIEYYPSAAVKSEIKNQGYNINFLAIKLRLIKYEINKQKYICGTTLLDKKYRKEEFSQIYHGRWGIEELYKISKKLIDVEDFHAKFERGVKQELYAHFLLINIARIFESKANDHFSNFSEERNAEDENDENNLRDSYWKDFCGKISKYKTNFKNCLLVIGRHIEKMIMSLGDEPLSWLSKILKSIARIKQKIRPGRHYPRKSEKPRGNWKSSNTVKLTRQRA